jgi:hypothetical protein
MVAMESGNWAEWATAGVAVGALGFAWWQINEAKGSRADSTTLAHDEATLQVWNDYLRLCFQHPEYSSAEMVKRILPGKTLEGILKQLSCESERYLWFLSIMMNSCEQVLLRQPSEITWRRALKAQIGYHSEVIEVLWDSGWSDHYGSEMNTLVREALMEAHANA